jgi:Tol biopolymer transport system component
MRIILLLPLLVLTLSAQSSPRELFERARMLEESNNKLVDAIALYKQVAAQSTDRPLAAAAQLRIGLLHERLGQKDEAQRAFRIIVERYADQTEIARQAQGKLAAAAPPGAAAAAARRAWAGDDIDLSGMPSPDGRYLSYVDWETGDLAVRDVAAGTRRRLTNNPPFDQASGFAQESAFSPDGKEIAYAWFHDQGMDLRIVRVDGGGPRLLCKGADMPILRVSWSGDPRWVAVAHQSSGRTHRLAMVNTTTGAVRPLKSLDWRQPARIAVSPDGRYLAYDFPPKQDSPNRDIYLLAVDGSRETVAVEHTANDLYPAWTPDGRHLVFVSDRTGAPGLWAIPIEDGRPQGTARLLQPGTVRPLGFTRAGALFYALRTGTIDAYVASIDLASGRVLEPPRIAARNVTGVNSRPRWSPDGRALVYQADRTAGNGFGARRLILQDVDTGVERDVNVPLPYFQRAEWSPDGRAVLLQARSNNARGFFRVDVASGETTLAIPRPDGAGYAPSWAPDGRTVFYTSSGAAARGIVARDLQTGDERMVYPAPAGRGPGDSSVSPDGKWVAFREGNAPAAIKIVAASGGAAREIVRVDAPDIIPAFGGINWTADGQHLLFVRGSGRTGDDRTVWKVPAAGGNATATDLKARALRDLHLHPDGRRIAFSAGEGSDELWVLDRLLPIDAPSKTAASRTREKSR